MMSRWLGRGRRYGMTRLRIREEKRAPTALKSQNLPTDVAGEERWQQIGDCSLLVLCCCCYSTASVPTGAALVSGAARFALFPFWHGRCTPLRLE